MGPAPRLAEVAGPRPDQHRRALLLLVYCVFTISINQASAACIYLAQRLDLGRA